MECEYSHDEMILENIGNLTTFNPDSGEVETTSNTSLAIEDGIIVEKGIGEKFDCSECLVTPGFVDPHTHPVFLDLRVDEVAMRKAGATYEEIAAKGGGINSSINGVRNASEDELIERVSKRMDQMIKLECFLMVWKRKLKQSQELQIMLHQISGLVHLGTICRKIFKG